MVLTGLSDEKLAKHMQENGGEGLDVVIDRYQSKLKRYARSILRDPGDAEDVVQETFISVYQNINSFDPRLKFSSWIYRITHNKAVNVIRKRVFSLSLEEVGDVPDSRQEHQGVEKEIDRKNARQMLEQSLWVLPVKYKEVIYLRYFEDKTYEEISDILRVPKNTVGVRISRGTIMLKKKMNINVEDWL